MTPSSTSTRQGDSAPLSADAQGVLPTPAVCRWRLCGGPDSHRANGSIVCGHTYPDCQILRSHHAVDAARRLPTGGLEHRICRSFAEACRLRDAWDALAEETADLFSSFDWCALWWHYYGTGRELEIHLFLKGDRLVGVVPLFRQRLGVGPWRVRTLRLVGCDHSITACGFAVLPECADETLILLVDLLAQSDWDVLQLGRLPGCFPYARAITRLLRARPDVASCELGYDVLPQTVLDLPASFDEYLRGLSSRERHNIGQEKRRLDREHSVRTDDRATEPDTAFNEFIALHQRQWVQKGHRGHFDDWPDARAFHHDVAFVASGARRLYLRQIWVDEQPFCTEYAVRFGHRLHWLLSARSLDKRWHFCFPGRVGACDLFVAAIADGVRQIDMGNGLFEYKLKLGGRLEPLTYITAIRRGAWKGIKARILRVAALLHDILGYRLWYRRLLPHVPGVRLSLYRGWIRRQMWPADSHRLALRYRKATAWPWAAWRGLRRCLAHLHASGGASRLVQRYAHSPGRRRRVVYEAETSPAETSRSGVLAGFTLRSCHLMCDLKDTERAALEQYGGRFLLLQIADQIDRGGRLWLATHGHDLVTAWWTGPEVRQGRRANGPAEAVVRGLVTSARTPSTDAVHATLRRMLGDLATMGLVRVRTDVRDGDEVLRSALTATGFRVKPVWNYARQGTCVRLLYVALAAFCRCVTAFRLDSATEVVLCYHGVPERQRDRFIWQVRHLAKRRSRRQTPFVSLTFDDACASFSETALPALRAFGIPATIFVVSNDLDAGTSTEGALPYLGPGERPMSVDELCSAATHGLISVGSHTATHPHLTELDAGTLLRELSESKQVLEDLLGQPVEDVAVPHGEYNERVTLAARAAGYQRVFTLDEQLVSGRDRQGVIGRFQMSPEAWRIEFLLTCAGAYRWLYPWRCFVRRLRARLGMVRPLAPENV